MGFVSKPLRTVFYDWACSATLQRWAARAVVRQLLPEQPCLTKALVLRRSTNSTVACRDRKSEDEALLAHAWVEWDGTLLIGERHPLGRYKRFDDLEDEIRTPRTYR